MAWDPPDAPTLNAPVKKTWGQKVLDCLLWLYGQIGSSSPDGIPNGSFEIDSDANGIPDTWEWHAYPGGTGAINTTTPAHGAAGVEMVHPGGAGNGGGYYESDYAAISEDISPLLLFFHWATAAGMKNIVRFKYYDKDKNYLSSEDIYSSTSNPTTRTPFARFGIPPATARFLKVVLIGGYTDTDVAGTAYFDGLQFDSAPRTIYDNFTIAEGSSANPAYVDIGSAAIKIPKGFNLALIPGSIKNSITVANSMRYRISSTYSSGDNVFNDGTYVIVTRYLDISALSGAQTLYMQVEASGGGTTYGKKAISLATYIRQ